MNVDPRSLLAVLLACASLVFAFEARAYSTPEAFIEPASQGGGGGRWFSGSPADGFGCSVCHSAGPGQRELPLYVTGLPLSGYTLGEQREIVLSWPELSARWRELKPDPMQPAVPGAPVPAMGMVAELVAESGKASGVIEIRGGTATPLEQCEITRPNLKPRLAAKMFQVRAGTAPFLVKPDASGTLRCEARHLGQRCIIALSSCGAQQLRFIWTAPSSQEGPIWFSGGLVASEQRSNTPETDAVYEVSVPMLQAGASDSRYQETVRGTCSIAAARERDRASVMAWLLLAASALLVRRASRRRS
jgi:hypothetical protein